MLKFASPDVCNRVYLQHGYFDTKTACEKCNAIAMARYRADCEYRPTLGSKTVKELVVKGSKDHCVSQRLV
jgi:hypothetical protein